MKTLIKCISLIFIGICLLSFHSIAQEYNLITNWEFDDGMNGWQFWDGGADADATYELDDMGILSGDYSIRWDVIDGGAEIWYLQTYQSLPIYEGVEYFVDFLIAWEGPSELNLSFVWELAVDPYTKYLQVDTVLYDFSQSVQYSFISDSTDETANFKIFVGKNVDALVWIDKVYVSDVPLDDSAVDSRLQSLPKNFTLEQNHPNPFNPTTTISYNLCESGNIKLSVYNALGKEVAELVNDYQVEGNHSVTFDARDLPTGVYFNQLQVDGVFSEIKKMLFLK